MQVILRLFDDLSGIRASVSNLVLHFVPNGTVVAGKSAFELWRDIAGNENKTLDDFWAYLQGKPLQVVIVPLLGIVPDFAGNEVTYLLPFATHGLATVVSAQMGSYDGVKFVVDTDMRATYQVNGDVALTSNTQWSQGFVRLVGV